MLAQKIADLVAEGYVLHVWKGPVPFTINLELCKDSVCISYAFEELDIRFTRLDLEDLVCTVLDDMKEKIDNEPV